MVAFADIALNLPVDRLFTYAVPEPLRDRVRPGVRVRVPFRSRSVGGTCVAVRDRSPEFDVKSIDTLLSAEPLFTTSMLRTCRFLARRYGATLGEALDAALPFAVKTGGRRRMIPVARLAIAEAEVAETIARLEAEKPTKQKMARVLRILADAEGPLPLSELSSRAKVGESPIKSLAKRGFVAIVREAQVSDPLFAAPVERATRHEATGPQLEAIEAIVRAQASGASAGFLLFGVTGSGKTEVYLRALEDCVARGKQGIVLVPEIALTPQTVARFRSRFPRVAVLHSHLTDAERHDQWRRIQRGEADVVIGARSAIFAPTPRLGLIVIDEEHENTFKQQNTPRYDARVAAWARARFERAVLVLGTATPSLETWRKANIGRLRLLRLPARVGGGTLPEAIVADLRQVVAVPGKPRVLTDRLRLAIGEHVARNEQVILFLNRRGYATSAICAQCGTPEKCEHCDIVLVFHRRIGRVLCHYCGFERPLPQYCTTCRTPFRLRGFGTERVEEEVRYALPRARVARMDSDTMKARGAHEEVLTRFRAGEIDVLVGTQMIAKGLDFPNVTLVGIVSADTTLHLPDYRASERTFQMVAQVAGRTGRSAKGGRVIVQTHEPEHFSIRLALHHDFERFAELELRARAKDGYPPFGHIARVVIQGKNRPSVHAAAERLRNLLGEWLADETTELLGPAPAPIEVINDQYRMHIVAKAKERLGITRFVKIVRAQTNLPKAVRVLLDVDPLAML